MSRLFVCKKTILGDVRQTVNPYSASSLETIEQVFPQADIVKLMRSYRSTLQITRFALNILPNPDLIPMERHGAVPQVLGYASNDEEVNAIRVMIESFQASDYHSLGIICKTHKQAVYLYKALHLAHVHLLTAESTHFKEGVVITTVHLSKGLEFDAVIIPFASQRNYASEVDKSMLYIACTRAMHQLSLTYTQEQTKFIS